MITVKEYLELDKKNPFYKDYPTAEKDKELIIEYNKALIEKYPFLLPKNRWTGKVVEDYDYSYTEMDDMPRGWRVAFGDQLLEELKEELVKYNYLNDYTIMQIKEKWGQLCWYDTGTPIGKLSEDYVPVDTKFNDDSKIEYDHDNELLWKVSMDNYTPMFYEENGEQKTYTFEEYKEHNKDCVIHYGIYKILEKCKVQDIISKYEKMSATTCIDCGAQNVPLYESKGWVNYVCEACAEKRLKAYNDECNRKCTLEDQFSLCDGKDV